MARRNGNRVGAGEQQKQTDIENSPNTGTLYIVSTHIGNPDDVTLRAISVLRSVKVIAAEDRRVTGRLLAHYGIDAALCSLRPHAKAEVGLDQIKSALSAGDDVAVLCDAGTPLIADPGRSIVRIAIEMRCRIVPLPGAVAAVAALTISGLSTHRFAFDGFPPRAKSDRFQFFAALAAEKRTIVLYETRWYLPSTLQCLAKSLGGNRQIAVMRDLTRSTETTYRGLLRDIIEMFGNTPPRGEYVLVIEGLPDD